MKTFIGLTPVHRKKKKKLTLETIGKTLKNRELSIYYYNPNITKSYLLLLNHPISSSNENNAKEYFSK